MCKINNFLHIINGVTLMLFLNYNLIYKNSLLSINFFLNKEKDERN